MSLVNLATYIRSHMASHTRESNFHFNHPKDPEFHNPGLDHCWEEEGSYDNVVTDRYG